jgi:hypothetical protein
MEKPMQRHSPPVLEMVSFRLTSGTEPAAFINLAMATEASLRRQQGFGSRKLVQSPEGLWTDIVEWASLDAANAAAKAVLADPDFAPFIAAIDMATVAMAHPALVWRMD